MIVEVCFAVNNCWAVTSKEDPETKVYVRDVENTLLCEKHGPEDGKNKPCFEIDAVRQLRGEHARKY